jgi:hypothetical protein
MVGITGAGTIHLCMAGDGIIVGTEDGITGATVTTRIGIQVSMEASIIVGPFTTLGAMGIMEILMDTMVIITTDITAIMGIIADVTFPTVPAEEAVIIAATPEV